MADYKHSQNLRHGNSSPFNLTGILKLSFVEISLCKYEVLVYEHKEKLGINTNGTAHCAPVYRHNRYINSSLFGGQRWT